MARGCCFISRLRLDVILSDPATGQPLQLLDLLHGKTLLDRPVLMGASGKLPVRLVTVKLPEQVAAKRRRERKNNRDKRLVYNARTKFLLGYEIFVTNVGEEQLDSSQVLSAYGLRWRIEILFKAYSDALTTEPLSILKLMQWFALFIPTLLLASDRQKPFWLKRCARQIPKHCSYEKRARLDFISCFHSLT